MATVKIVLRIKNKKEGEKNNEIEHPLALRITKDRKSSFIYTGYKVRESEWDADTQRIKKSHKNSARLNNYLIKKLADATNTALELETIKTETSSRAVKQKIKPSGGATFFPQAEIYLENLKKSEKYSRYVSDKPRIKHFKEFLKDADYAFSDITVALLERFKLYLKTTYRTQRKKDGPGRPLAERSIVNHLTTIRSVFSQAIKAGITDSKYYPFGENRIVIKFPDSMKIGLSSEEVQLLEQAELTDPKANHARNLWLFSFYMAGMRVSDVFRLRWSDIHADRLHYAMGKNAKGGSLKLPEKALAILAQYKGRKAHRNDFIFPDLKKIDGIDDIFLTQKTISFATGRIDKILRNHVAPEAGIDKKLSMHIARHTFGNISGDKIPIQMLQKLYRHSSVTTTIGYQSNFIYKDADDALNAVVGF